MTIASVVQFTLYRRDEEPLQQLLHYLADKRLLLVLNNFEHLVAGAPQVTALLAQAPGVKVLTTSRERLNVQGEWLLEVSGLLYNLEAPLHQMTEYSAVQFFVQCARRVNSGFLLDEENQAVVARICSLVEGLPLALELAATWLRSLLCQEIVAELEQSLTTLSATQRDLPARHRCPPAPATEDEIRTKAVDLLVAAQSHLTTDALAEAVNIGPTVELWQVITDVIGIVG